MVDHQTTRQQDNETRDDAVARRGRGQPPSPGYSESVHEHAGVPGWSVVPPTRSCGVAGSRLREATARQGSQWSFRKRRFTLPKQRDPESLRGFTLAELLVSMVVLVILVFLATHLVNSAATVTILGHKRMDADSQARQVFDRMAVDFAQMLRRKDVDYYGKLLSLQQVNRNDQTAFYSAVPGYYPSGSTGTQQSPLSLVAYRVNNNSTSPAYNRLERLGKGLVWNGLSATPTPAPLVFLPVTISTMWPYATNQDPDPAYEVIGPDVFRFECYYQLKDGTYWDAICKGANCTWDVSAIVVTIAVIDPRSRLLLNDSQIATLNGNSASLSSNFLLDYRTDFDKPGLLPNFWQQKLNTIIRTGSLPRQAVSGIRVYERFFNVSQ